jgi:hypothetical protein
VEPAAAAAAPAPGDAALPSPWRELSALFAVVAAALASLAASAARFPAWAAAGRLRRLRDAADEEPASAVRQAELLAALNATGGVAGAREVLTRVESKQVRCV